MYFLINKTLLSIIFLLILFSCGDTNQNPPSKKQPVLLAQNYFIAYYHGAIRNAQKLELILYNWTDGNLNGSLVLEGEEPINLTGELNLDENVIMIADFDKGDNLEMRFSFGDPCELNGNLMKDDIKSTFTLSCISSKFSTDGTFVKEDAGSLGTLVTYKRNETEKYNLLHLVEENLEIKMFGEKGKEQKVLLIPSNTTEQDFSFCQFKIKGDEEQDKLYVVPLLTTDCEDKVSGEYQRME